MTHNQISFDEALNKAKSLGYAESNPKSDLNGEDVAAIKNSNQFLLIQKLIIQYILKELRILIILILLMLTI